MSIRGFDTLPRLVPRPSGLPDWISVATLWKPVMQAGGWREENFAIFYDGEFNTPAHMEILLHLVDTWGIERAVEHLLAARARELR